MRFWRKLKKKGGPNGGIEYGTTCQIFRKKNVFLLLKNAPSKTAEEKCAKRVENGQKRPFLGVFWCFFNKFLYFFFINFAKMGVFMLRNKRFCEFYRPKNLSFFYDFRSVNICFHVKILTNFITFLSKTPSKTLRKKERFTTCT